MSEEPCQVSQVVEGAFGAGITKVRVRVRVRVRVDGRARAVHKLACTQYTNSRARSTQTRARTPVPPLQTTMECTI